MSAEWEEQENLPFTLLHCLHSSALSAVMIAVPTAISEPPEATWLTDGLTVEVVTFNLPG